MGRVDPSAGAAPGPSNLCCAVQGELAAELEGLATDPALQACCQRDAQEQAYVARVKQRLLAHDRTDARRLLAAAAVRRGSDAASDDDADSLASAGDEATPELARLRELRLGELQQAALLRARLQAAGRGSVTTVADAALLDEVRDTDADAVVCHLVIVGTQLGEQMDEHLAALAHAFPGTRFLRAPLSRRLALPRALGLQHASALVVFVRGAAAARATAAAFSDGADLREEDVSAWLRRARALRAPGQGAAGAGGDAAASEDEGEETDADRREPCSECGRRYYHEHIRAAHASDAGSDSGGDG